MVSVDVKPHGSFLQPTAAYGRAVPRCGVPVQHARDGVCACVQSVARPAADPARAAHSALTRGRDDQPVGGGCEGGTLLH